MKKYKTAAVVTGILSVVPLGAAAGIPAVQKTAAAAKTTAKAAPTHATRGTVKSIDDATLVLAHGGKKNADMTFTLNGSTQKDGAIAVGSPVSVRYREDGKTNVATAIRVESAKKKTAASAKR